MPIAKIHPPEKLPVRGLTEQQFQVWQTQLRAWLYCDEALSHFLTDGRYAEWEAEEVNPHRIAELLGNPDPELPQNPTAAQETDLLTKRRRQLVIFLSQVANCVSVNHYTTVLRHATSLQWIFDKIRLDYDLSHRGIHFMNLSRIKYDPDTMTPAGFYQLYRAHIIDH